MLDYAFGSHALPTRRRDLTETTREMIKRGTDDLKQLAIPQSNLVRPLLCVLSPLLIDLCLVPHRPSFTPRALSQPYHSALLKKTSHDLQLSLAAFQNAQKLSAERQRTVVQVVKQTAGEHDGAIGGASSGPAGPSGSPGSLCLQQTQLQIKYVCRSARFLEDEIEC